MRASSAWSPSGSSRRTPDASERGSDADTTARAALAVERLDGVGVGAAGSAAQPPSHSSTSSPASATRRWRLAGEQLGRRVAAQASRRRTGLAPASIRRQRHAVVSGVWSLVFVTHGRQLHGRRLSPDVVARGGVCQLQSSTGPMAPRWTPARRAAGVDQARTGRSASGQSRPRHRPAIAERRRDPWTIGPVDSPGMTAAPLAGTNAAMPDHPQPTGNGAHGIDGTVPPALLDALVRAGQQRVIKGTLVVTEGEPALSMYVVLEGSLRVLAVEATRTAAKCS